MKNNRLINFLKRHFSLLDDEVIEFQPDRVEVELRRLPRSARTTLYVIAALLGCAVYWAYAAEVDRVVSAQGKLTEVGQRILVQPLTLSRISSIHVEVGDIVKKGQVLVELDSTMLDVLESRLAVKKQLSEMYRSLQSKGYGARADYLRALDAERELAAELQNARLVELTAIEDAIVLDVTRKSSGSVIQPAEALVTLIPLNATLVAEVNISARDIGWVRTGQSVRIKLDAFPFQQHGILQGELKVISPDAITEMRKQTSLEEESQDNQQPLQAQAVYKGKIRLLEGLDALRNVPPNFRLLPGMTVSAEIKSGKRRVISYFLDPIIRGIDESIREPR